MVKRTKMFYWTLEDARNGRLPAAVARIAKGIR